jgi:hypothetical protein
MFRQNMPSSGSNYVTSEPLQGQYGGRQVWVLVSYHTDIEVAQ